MARVDRSKAHFRVVLRESREGVSRNLRRAAKGIIYVDVGEKYGEILLTVENLKYLGTAPNRLPYYYEGWMILNNGYKLSMGPVSIDGKGSGKNYWRFASVAAGNTGIAISEIAGFAVTMEAMDGNPYPTDLVVLAGTVSKEETTPRPPLTPGYTNQPYDGTQRPAGTTGATHKGAGGKPASPAYIPYSWWPVCMPGMSTQEAPFLFGYPAGKSGVERVAFGFPGLPDRPALTNEAGEWRPTGTDNAHGYWVYHRRTGAGG